VIAFETNHKAEAIVHWQRAIEINPREWDTLSNLCKVMLDEGRREEARPYVERFLREAPASQYGEELRRYRAALDR
jgi:tetratricopeptide (TPR) repeat protein